MNVTELARKVRVTTEELREMLPQLGFDIGKKAIKIDDVQANRIIQNWSRLKKEWDFMEAKKRKEAEDALGPKKEVQKTKVAIPQLLTVREFAQLADKPVNQVIQQLMKNGIFASLNEQIDFDTASIIGDDLELEVVSLKQEAGEDAGDQTMSDILGKESAENMQHRPPVVVVMGHVDHGKTALLDAIRSTNIIDTEHGGITQRIGAYQVEKNGKKISFIDTPGHEAFTAMRSRGARVADIAILVVAADDSVMPQTVEALRIIENSHIPMIVAINKIDKEGANLDKVKQDLSQHNLLPEEWGGKTIMTPVSALTGDGVDDLLETLLLVAETEGSDIKANPNAHAAGTVVESHVDKNEGPVATILVQNGTLRVGDYLGTEDQFFGKVRSMKDWRGDDVQEAGPSMPVKILGFKTVPNIGDVLAVQSEADAKKLRKSTKKQHTVMDTSSRIVDRARQNGGEEDAVVHQFNVIIRADVLGVLEAIVESFEKLEQENVKISIVSKGVGHITENDIMTAQATDAYLVAFNVSVSPEMQQLAKSHSVEIHEHTIIYKLLDDIKDKFQKQIKPEIVIKEIAQIEVLALFQSGKDMQVLGGKVISGIAKPGRKVEVMREGILFSTGSIDEVQSGKQQVSEVPEGSECGLLFKGDPVVREKDILRVIEEEEKEVSL